MSESEPPADGIERRGVLAALAAGVGGVGLAQGSIADSSAADASGYVLEQGDRCVPITPLSGEQTVEDFYDYRTPDTDPSAYTYSSYGTTHLQRPETSICFLYEGPDGLSLVVVHDELEDGTDGGSASFALRFEHPDRGAWVVGDDDYDGETNYDRFEETADGWRVDWTWGEGRTDGGVYRPLGDDFAVTVDPAFNEDAALYGEHYDGEIADWQILSGDRDDPERVSLAMDQPVTIRPGTCGETTTTTTRAETTTAETTTEETTSEETTAEDDETSEEDQPSGQISVEVEIVPGKVNPRSRGRLPVVIYSDAEFDATDLAEISFGPGRAAPAGRTRTDEDGDGHPDLKLHFRMGELGVDWGTDRLRLTGETENGRPVVGTADVDLVPNGSDDEDDERRGDDESEEKDEREDDEQKNERRGDDESDGGGETDDEEDGDEDGDDDDDEEDDAEEDDDEEGDDDEDDWKWRDDDDEDGDDDWWGGDDDDEDWLDDDGEDDSSGLWGDDNDDDDRGRGSGKGKGRDRGNDGNGRGRGNDEDGRGRGKDEDEE